MSGSPVGAVSGCDFPAVRVSRFGEPREVVEYARFPVEPAGEGFVLVRVDYAPINPADLNVLEGRYGALPALPFVPGVEGVGTVLESRFAGLQPGQRVLLPAGFGTWRARGVVGGAQLIPVPEQVDPRQAAMLRINPATAHCMLLALVNLPAGAWVVQNAANSGVGRAVIQIARILGLRTVNVVRREGLDSDLERLGADTVLVEGPGLARRIRERTGTAELRLALNAVGGDCALELAKALDESGTLVTYGAMARQPLRIPNGLLIFRDLKLRGFWVSRWYRDADPGRVRALFDDLLKWVAEGKICTPVEAVYPLAHIRDAIQHAGRDFRSGKILLQPEKDWDRGSSLE